MKTTKNLLAIALVATIAFGAQSCKKDSSTDSTTTNPNPTPTANDQTALFSQQASDQTQQMSETESAMAEASMGAESTDTSSHDNHGGLLGGLFHYNSNGSLSIVYSGNNSDGSRYRSGKIDLNLISGSHYYDQNAQSSIKFTNYLSRRVNNNSGNSNFILNGTLNVTSMTSGRTADMNNGEHRMQRITGDLMVTFEDGTQRTWHITRDREVGKDNNGNRYVRILGSGSYNGSSNVSEYGTNRAGHSFYTVINTAIHYNDNCGRNRAVAGSVSYKGIERDVNNTYGVDANGNATSTSGSSCDAYGYKMTWADANATTQTRIIQYRN